MISAPLRPIQRIRIAASTVAGIFCILLVVMWGRSYWFNETIMGPAYDNRILGISSFEGWLTIRYAAGDMEPSLFPRWMVQSMPYSQMEEVFRMENNIGTQHLFGWVVAI
jgi:hypothetical protein